MVWRIGEAVASKLAKVLVAFLFSALPVVAFAAPARADAPGDIVTWVNTLRSGSGVAALGADPALTGVAQQWANHMAAAGDLSHNPNLATQVPQGWTKIGENIGSGYSLTAVYNGLLASPFHLANMVDPAYNRTGVGIAADANGVVWLAEDFGAYPPPVPATFTFPTPGALIFGVPQSFTWAQTPGAVYYCATVGTTRGGVDFLNTGLLDATRLFAAVPALPGGAFWARIYTYTQGAWIFTDTNFSVTGAATAVLTYPTNGATNVDTTQPFTWTPVAAANWYLLTVGNTKGGIDYLNSGLISPTQSSFQVPGLPAGKTLQARLYSFIAGTWNHYNDITFTTR